MPRRFRGMKDADPAGKSGRNFGDGSYDLVILGMRDAGEGDAYFCSEFAIVACDEAVDSNGRAFESGDTASVLYKYGERTTNGHVKALVLGMSDDLEPEEVDEAFCDDLMADNQPARGVCMHLHAVTKPQKKDPSKDYTYLNWRPVEPSFYDDNADRIAELLEEHKL